MKYFFLLVLVFAIPTAVFLYIKNITNNIVVEAPEIPASLISSTTSVVENRFPDLAVEKQTTSTQPRSSLSTQYPEEGDTVLLSIFDKNLVPQKASFMNNVVSFFPYKNSVSSFIPIPIGSAGNHELKMVFTSGEEMTRVIYVKKKTFPVYNVGIPKKLGITAPELIKQLADEKKQLDVILNIRTDNVFFTRPFIAPVKDTRVTGTFGEIRKTGANEIRHLGVDFAPPDGSVVFASNDGVIKKAGSDPIYGNMVIIDHGEGIFSMYLHMKSVSIKEGDTITQGQIIGIVGDTGYSTGEHLHLSIKINGISVDPLKFIETLK